MISCSVALPFPSPFPLSSAAECYSSGPFLSSSHWSGRLSLACLLACLCCRGVRSFFSLRARATKGWRQARRLGSHRVFTCSVSWRNMELLASSLELLVRMEWSAFFFPYFNYDHTQASCGVFTLPTLININEEKRLLGPLGERLGRCWAKFSFVSNTQTCQYSLGPRREGEAGPRLWRPHRITGLDACRSASGKVWGTPC